MNAPAPPLLEVDLRSPAFKDDPMPTWRRVQGAGDVVAARVPLLGTVAFATRREAARRVLEEPEAFSLDARRAGRRGRTGTEWWVPPAFRRLADNLLVREGEEHRVLRRRVEAAFRRPALEALQARIEARCEACLDAFERGDRGRRGGSRPGGARHDFVRDVARPLPIGVIGDLLGLDPEESAPERPLGRALARLSGIGGPLDLFRLGPALGTVSRALGRELEARRRAPREDLLTALAHAVDADAEAGGGTGARPHASAGDADPFDERAAISMVFLLYVAGHETTVHLLSGATLELLRRPGAREALPARIDAGAVGELMRWLSPVQFAKPRFVVRDVELAGARLARGSTVAPLIGAANADDRAFDDPEALDFSRPPSRHLGFGAGPHVCLGLQLALRETATVLERLLDRFPALALEAPAAMPAWTSRPGLRALEALPLVPRGSRPPRSGGRADGA